MLKYENFPFRDEWIRRAGIHSKNKVPEDENLRLYFSLMEAIDFDCFKFKDCPPKPTKEEIIDFLKMHKDEIISSNMDPPSYLGAFSGTFKFLFDK